MGATLSSETTAAATGAVGVVRRDPFAMLPFIGYNAGDYFNHWINGRQGARRRQAAEDLLRQLVPPQRRRRRSSGPGFGENGRVLKWAIERMAGTAAARETPIGHVPDAGVARHRRPGHDARGPRVCLTVDADEWRAEIPQITEWFEKFGDKLPTVLWTELDGLKARLGAE